MKGKMISKRIATAMLACGLVFTSVAVPQTNVQAASAKAVKSVVLKVNSKKVTGKTITLTEGDKVTVKTTVKPASAKKKITFKSSKKKVATVSKKGIVTAKKAGTSKITVTVTGKKNKKKTACFKVNVEEQDTRQNAQTTENKATESSTTTAQTPETNVQATTEASKIVVDTSAYVSGTETKPTQNPANQTTEAIVDNNKIIATVKKNPVVVGEKLVISLSVEGTTDVEYAFGNEPGVLEYYKDGKWVKLQTKSGIMWTAEAAILSLKYRNYLYVPLSYYYGDLEPGHYRYTKSMLIRDKEFAVEFDVEPKPAGEEATTEAAYIPNGDSTTEEGTTEQKTEEPVKIPTEDKTEEPTDDTTGDKSDEKEDVVDNNKIIATLKKNPIAVGENLVILLSVEGENDVEYAFGEAPGILECYRNDKWETIQTQPGNSWVEDAAVLSLQYGNSLTVPLSYYYGDLEPGHYRYTKSMLIRDKEFAVEFDVEG